MSLITARRRHEDASAGVLNEDILHELSAMAAKRFTGSVDVVDKATRSQARIYLYQGGLYGIELDGYRPAILPRLLASGALDGRSPEELSALTAVDAAHAGGWAVESGWVSVGALAGVHQEVLLASLGAVLSLAKAKVRTRKGATTSYACTLPLPVEPLYDVVRMRLDRLDGTVSMLAPGLPAGGVVLRRTQVPTSFHGSASEQGALCGEIDGVRSLDALACSIGFTRAEAAHVASLLVASGVATMVVDAEYDSGHARHLVPESFGSFAATDVLGPIAERPRPQDVAGPVEGDSTEPAAAVQDPPVTAAATVLTASAVRGPSAGEAAIAAARAAVSDLLDELQESIHLEQEAIARTAHVSQRLRDARMELARLEAPALSPTG